MIFRLIELACRARRCTCRVPAARGIPFSSPALIDRRHQIPFELISIGTFRLFAQAHPGRSSMITFRFIAVTTAFTAAAVAGRPPLAQAQAESSASTTQEAPSAQPAPSAQQAHQRRLRSRLAGRTDSSFSRPTATSACRSGCSSTPTAASRWTIPNEQVVDTFAFRRLRPYLRGRFSRRFEFYLNPDFAGGTLVVQDAYVDTIFSPAFRIRAGKGKTPFGLERLHSASNLLFFERALPTALVPNRDLGIQVLGDISGGVVSYLAGVMNGVPDGGSADLDTNDGKDVSGRLVVRPFNKIATSPLRGLGLAISGSTGRQTGAGALPTFRTQSLQQPYFSYSGASADGVRTPVLAAGLLLLQGVRRLRRVRAHEDAGPEGTSFEKTSRTTPGRSPDRIVLTGEAATDAGAGVRPRANFDFGNGHLGAFQIAARYHALKVDERAFTLGLAAAGVEPQGRGLDGRAELVPHAELPVHRSISNAPSSTTIPTGRARRKTRFVFRTQVNF